MQGLDNVIKLFLCYFSVSLLLRYIRVTPSVKWASPICRVCLQRQGEQESKQEWVICVTDIPPPPPPPCKKSERETSISDRSWTGERRSRKVKYLFYSLYAWKMNECSFCDVVWNMHAQVHIPRPSPGFSHCNVVGQFGSSGQASEDSSRTPASRNEYVWEYISRPKIPIRILCKLSKKGLYSTCHPHLGNLLPRQHETGKHILLLPTINIYEHVNQPWKPFIIMLHTSLNGLTLMQ